MAHVDINGLKFKQTRKKKYDVYVCMPAKGTHVTNRLEGSEYCTDENKPFVISGTVGETWVIDANKLAKTYTFADGSPITPDALKSRVKNGIIDWMHLTTKQTGMELNFAAHLPLSVTNFPVQTSWGDTLYANRDGVAHGKGDFIVCASINGQPNLNDVWVVNGEVFPTTYDMRAFPGLGSGLVKETPVPKSIASAISNRVKLGSYLKQRLRQCNVYVENVVENNDKEDDPIYLAGNVYNIQINLLGDNQFEIFVMTDVDADDWDQLGTKVVTGTNNITKAIMEIIRGNKKGKKYITDYIVNGLRQRGDRVGKVQDDGGENVSFSVNNGTYGVILYINEGNPVEGSNSISLMYHNNNNWDEAATWFIDDYGIDESINKLHALINGSTNLDGMIAKVNEHMPGAIQDDYAFEAYGIGNNQELEKPAYFKQLLKTYEYVKDKLQLENNGELITATGEEPLHWRIDFYTRLCPDAIPFIDIYPDNITTCVQTQDGDHWEQSFPTGADGCKKAFQYIASVIKAIKQGGN